MRQLRLKPRPPGRVSGVLLSALCLAAVGGAAAAAPVAAAPVAAAAPAGSPAAAAVADGPSRSFGEPAAAQDSSAGVVAATRFSSRGAARVDAWTRPAGAGRWRPAGSLLPSGFGSSYDASAAAAPGGPALVAAGTAPAGQKCIGGGSVAVAAARAGGGLAPARLVSDQRGTGRFDDRPAVAVGPGGTVWVAWSEGPDADSCQNVGTGDRLEAVVSHDGGRTFGAPVELPAAGGNSAFGARLVPLPGGRAAVSWTERFPGHQESVLVSVLGPDGRPSPPRRVLTGTAPPLGLPGASFYDFPAGDIAALPGGALAVAVPLWQAGRTVIGLASGTAGGRWRTSEVGPPRGADLLLPALANAPAGTLRLLCAVHTRSGDRLGYDSAGIRFAQSGPAASGLAPVTPAPNGPGFFEIGEELSLSQAPGGLLAPVVVAGGSGARLETLTWRQPVVPVAGQGEQSAHPGAASPASRTPDPGIAGPLWTAVAILLAAAAGLAAWRWVRHSRV